MQKGLGAVQAGFGDVWVGIRDEAVQGFLSPEVSLCWQAALCVSRMPRFPGSRMGMLR